MDGFQVFGQQNDSNVNVMDETGEILVQNRDYVNRWHSSPNGTRRDALAVAT